MKDVTDKNFGVIIAFLLPGFLLLWGLSYSWPGIANWLARASTSEAPTVGGFFYATLASLALGLVINALRWAIVNQILYGITKLNRSSIDFTKLTNEHTLAAFQGAVENNYRYYQYYSNTFIAIAGAYGSHILFATEALPWLAHPLIVLLSLILLFASRNELKMFNERATQITK